MPDSRSQKKLSSFFEKLRTHTYTIFPLELVLSRREIAELISFTDENTTDEEHQIYVLGQAFGGLVGQRGQVIASRVERKISLELKNSNLQEQLKLESFILRTSKNEIPPAHHKHIDEDTYFTIILALESDGPILYLLTKSGRHKKVRVRSGHGVVMSGGVRAIREPTVTATTHSAPRKKFTRRTIGILVFNVL